MRIGIGIAGIGVELLCVAGVALDAPAAVWVLALLIGALLILFAFAFGASEGAVAPESVAEAVGGSGEGHVRGNVFGDNATITIADGAHRSSAPAKRSLIRVSVADLTRIYKEHTAVQAEKLIEPYIDGWLKVEGLVSDVAKDTWGNGYRVVVRVGEDLVFACFVQEAQEELPRLLRDDEVSLVGRVAGVGPYDLQLENSELLDAEP